MYIRKNIPNFLTCLNLLCGSIGILLTLRENVPFICVTYLIGLAALLDFSDGLVARVLKAHSEIGKELDSLADIVSFGLLPGFILFRLINTSFLSMHQNSFHLAYLALLVPVFSAIRLAKFNIDTHQSDSFIGLPTPANSLLIASFVGIPLLWNPWLLITVTLVTSYLLVSPIPLFALKFKNFSWPDNKIRYVFLAASLALLLSLRFASMPVIILVYIFMSAVA